MSNSETSNDKKASHGRKGDSRMHKAVAARLKNPKMTLFEALRVGGFDYASDEAVAVDSENVALGQRKNQLSRRLRLARKNPPKTTEDEGSESSFAASSSLPDTPSGGAAALSGSAQRDLQRMMLQWRQPSESTSAIGARALQMKREHPALGDMLDDEVNPNPSEDYHLEEANKRPRVAKFHPDFAPLFVPPVSSVRNTKNTTDAATIGTNAPSVAATVAAPSAVPGTASAASLSHMSLFTPELAPNPFISHGTRPSAVAISSLSNSAQVAGMTLEQLAMVLASNPTFLPKLMVENTSPDEQTKKMNLALQLFETECKALYSRCLLLAGISTSECQPNSPLYNDFVKKAWEREGKRLKRIGSHQRTLSDESVDFVGVGQSTTQSSLAFSLKSHRPEDSNKENSSIHNEEGSHAGRGKECDGRHIHRIDGQCGHKAIIHKPTNGSAHIDFVVGNKVECYHGIEPLGKSTETGWPSRFKCKETGEHISCVADLYKELPEGAVPKVIELSEINLQDPEWNYDVTGSIDGGIAGLFRLGAEDQKDTTT